MLALVFLGFCHHAFAICEQYPNPSKAFQDCFTAYGDAQIQSTAGDIQATNDMLNRPTPKKAVTATAPAPKPAANPVAPARKRVKVEKSRAVSWEDMPMCWF